MGQKAGFKFRVMDCRQNLKFVTVLSPSPVQAAGRLSESESVRTVTRDGAVTIPSQVRRSVTVQYLTSTE